ncbi:bifunctional diaminohydroxyphosphoribosylaminopyrimidine deaminase/5-amino-6-(5-phosphoribosylamino)uracil reductase RibD [bacterium]|nr:bifunctional diaminohydroxyphosphoribosylaminopyrimidine deaminase/5-amino-6-(5-phosphoribosylamino)uracil reductase RibD [bacterium]
MNEDERYMRLALRLGTKGLGRTHPNPPVGAVIVCEGKIVGRGFHKRAGLPHAEVEAIEDALKKGFSNFEEATIYVTLEPCSHYGKTPPCAKLIASKKFRRVVVGTVDPNPLVNGRGIKIMRDGGIDVQVGVLEREAKKLIEHFSTFIAEHRAFLSVKWAQSLDGKIAAQDGSSKWISSERARKFAHKLRNIHDVVIVGAGTVIADNPELTVRHIRGRNPVRVVIGGRRKISPNLKIFSDDAATTILFTPLKNPFTAGLPEGEIEIFYQKIGSDGRISLKAVLRKLASLGYTSALLEGGSQMIASALSEKVADRIYAIISPKIIGENGISAVSAITGKNISEAIRLSDVEIRRLGQDVVIIGKIVR